jgi:gentisate 1,2-dioxygenase
MAEPAKARNPEREAFYAEIGEHSLSPLWEVLHDLVPKSPRSPVLPALWHYEDVRPFLMRAGSLITAKEAERRVLVLRNPGLGGREAITQTLYAGLQLILPGEIAPAHRHTQSALRFVIEGQGAYTAVDGERTLMNPGDFIITPSWTWHDHGNDSDKPMVWLDGLDVPLVAMLDAGFAETYNAEKQLASRPEGDALARYGSGLLPVDYKPATKTSPIFNYPYGRTREALETLCRAREIDPWHGIKLRYVNPATGDWAMPTMATFMQLLPKGFSTQPYRSTDAVIYVAVEGEGETRIGDTVFAWKPLDVFVVPGWTTHSHHPTGEAVMFSFSDRPIHEKLDLWREERIKH